VPALAFGAGAVAFFAVPYTILIYPLLFLVFPRLWQVCSKHGYLTAGDFVRGRFGNRWLALAIAVTGLPDPCRLHLHQRAEGAGVDRRRQGRADLPDGDRGGDRDPDAAWGF
jgi:hypothetical protein